MINTDHMQPTII